MQPLISTSEDAKAQRAKSCPIPQSSRVCSHCKLPDFLLHTLSILPAGVSLGREEAFHYRIHTLWLRSPKCLDQCKFFSMTVWCCVGWKSFVVFLFFSSTTYSTTVFCKACLTGTSNTKSSGNILRFVVCIFPPPIKSSLLNYHTKGREKPFLSSPKEKGF